MTLHVLRPFGSLTREIGPAPPRLGTIRLCPTTFISSVSSESIVVAWTDIAKRVATLSRRRAARKDGRLALVISAVEDVGGES